MPRFISGRDVYVVVLRVSDGLVQIKKRIYNLKYSFVSIFTSGDTRL